MATVQLDGAGVRIALTRGDKWSALRRRDVTLPWGSIRSAEFAAEPLRLVTGLRAPGLSIPGRTRTGTWLKRGRTTFAVTRKGRPGLRLRLKDGSYHQVLVSVPDGAALAAEVSRRATDAATTARGRAVERPITFLSDGVPLGGTVLIPATLPPATLPPATLPPATSLPAPGGPIVAAAVIVTGSGRLDRDANGRSARLTVSRDLAEAMADAGVASLRYDKRGVGASGGDYLHAGVGDNIADARAALDALASQPECAGASLVLIGHSEGAMIATAVAADPPAGLAGVVLLAATAKNGEQTVTWQAQQIAPALPTAARAVLRVLRTTPEQQQRKALKKITAASGDVTRLLGVRVSAKRFREFLAFDPRPLLARITVPVLAITGEKDLLVDPDDLDVIAATVRGRVVVDRVPDLSHILRRNPGRPTVRDYRRQMREPVDAAVLAEITRWVAATAGSHRAGAPDR